MRDVFYLCVLYNGITAYSIVMLDFLPIAIKEALRHVNERHIYEIRLRAGKPTMMNYLGNYRYLGYNGVCQTAQAAIVCNENELNDCVYKAGKFSVYAIEEQIKKGFITAIGGARIGIAGEYVFERGQPLTIRNITSLCIRVPHEVLGCGWTIFTSCMSDKLCNLLLCSPPGYGKTTILRDLVRIISNKTKKNILICDERGEIAVGDIGDTCDVLKFSSKEVAFEAGIRAMRPDIIITDELSSNDCSAIAYAVRSGVYVIASAHFASYNQLTRSFGGLFDRYVFLSTEEMGEIQAIYDKSGGQIDGY